jgi:nucleoside-diphosphate-sugar epimerase
MSSVLILGAGYLGAVLAELALADGAEVCLADNWYAAKREQLDGLEAAGARVETADLRSAEDMARLLGEGPERVYLLAAQASRPISERDPDYTEETNLTGARRVAEAVAEAGDPSLVYASSLNVYGHELRGEVDVDHPYGAQGDLAHLSKVYGELCLRMYAERAGFDLAILRLGIVYGPSPVEHTDPGRQTVVDKFRRLAKAGEELPLDDGGTATIGVVHVRDAAQALWESPLEPGVTVHNVAAESVTVGDVAALARGDEPEGQPAFAFRSPFEYRHRLAEYLAA